MSGEHSAETLLTLAELRPSAVKLLTRTDGGKPDGEPLTEFTSQVLSLGTPGLVAAGVLNASACALLAEEMGRQGRTVVAVLSRVVPWRHEGGVAINAILSAYVAHNPRQALTWIEREVTEGRAEGLARGFGERLIFCVESAGLLGGRSSDEVVAAYLEAFFDGLGA
ncbi:hypothetical protein [Knoellia flava]|nr:hypothetical protein [Knoellia flava]